METVNLPTRNRQQTSKDLDAELFDVDDNSTRAEIKIAYIGGGSRAWAVQMMGDLALSSRLSGVLSLYDIDSAAAAHNQHLSREIFSHPDARTEFEVRVEAKLPDALRGADFVVISIEPGPTRLRYADLEIPAQFGLLQTVGDTTGPGGILRALRSVPLFQEFARAIMEHCPSSWVINYTNPMAICTAALQAEAPGMKVFGCCHEVFATQKRLAALVEQWFEIKRPAREEISLNIAGVNHFTWATNASWQGHDLMPRIRDLIGQADFFHDRTAQAEAAEKKEDWFWSEGLVAYDLLRRFGALGAAGDRHLVEFVPWYLSSDKQLHQWGVIRTPYSWRLQRNDKPSNSIGSYAGQKLKRSGEEGVRQIEALLGLGDLTTNVNLPNRGQLPGFANGLIVESYAEFRHNCLRPILSDPLPDGAASFVRRAIDEQAMTLAAALNRDIDLAFQALLTHPLVCLSTDQAWTMFREMINATREMLPGWK